MNRIDEWSQLLSSTNPHHASPRLEESSPTRSAREIITAAILSAKVLDFLHAAAASEPLLIIANDTHRFTDTASAIDCLVDLCRVHQIQITFRLLIGTGSHTFANPQEKSAHERQIIGAHEERFIEIAWHDAFDPGQHVTIHPDHPARLHHWMAESPFVLAIGSMEPHYFAGVTGAHKTCTIGLMEYDAITANHSHALQPEACGLRLKGNPIYEGLAAVIRLIEGTGKQIFAINEIIGSARVIDCYAGHPLESLERALPRLHALFGASLAEPQDLIVSIVHPPLDRDLYQADKGIKNVECCVRDGGIIILDAACHHGIGIDRFHQLLKRAATHREALELIEREGYRLGDHKAVRLRALTDTHNVQLAAVAPGLTPTDAQDCAIRLFPTRQQAAEWALPRLPQNPRTLIADDSGNITLSLSDDCP